jgi:hypothetical protein
MCIDGIKAVYANLRRQNLNKIQALYNLWFKQKYLSYEKCKTNLNARKICRNLEEHGKKMTIQEAEIALEFIYEFAELSIAEKCKTNLTYYYLVKIHLKLEI